MIFVARKTIDVNVLPRVDVLGDTLKVSLIDLGGKRPMTGLHDPATVPGTGVLDERVYRLAEFDADASGKKYFLMHDRRPALQNPVDVFARFGNSSYDSLFRGPDVLYSAVVIYQPVPFRSFADLHYVFCRPALMTGAFEFYDENEAHAFSFRLMPERPPFDAKNG